MRLTTLSLENKEGWCPIRRYWSEWSGESNNRLPFGYSDGYLWRPERGQHTALGRKAYRTLESLADAPCVVLLGDAGAGKTTTLSSYASALQHKLGQSDDVLQAFEARSLRSRADVSKWLTSDVIESWVSGTHRLHLLVDGVDESPVGAADLVDEISEAMEQWPVERLRLRLTIQSTVYSNAISTALNAALKTASARAVRRSPEGDIAAPHSAHEAALVLVLASLQFDDAKAIATNVLGDDVQADAFLRLVDAAGAQPFAALPLTLSALLQQFKATRQLETRVPDLYSTLCASLCVPRNKGETHSVRQKSQKSIRDWMRLATEICAALVFGRRVGVWHGDADPGSEYLRLDDLLGSRLHVFGTIHPTREELGAVLSSALFTADSVNPEQAVVVTKTVYAEFLAARWLLDAELSVDQCLQLLGSGDPRALPILPHLRHVATWAASLSQEIAKAIIGMDPEAAVWHARADLPVSVRATLIDTLIERADRNALRSPQFGFWQSLSRLEHAHIAPQLLSVITDATRSNEARLLAMDIAQASRIGGVDKEAVAIALDPRQSRELRVEGARTVATVGGQASRQRLCGLATLPDPFDDEQLRGAALLAAWRTMSPPALFRALRPRSRDSFYGSYASALHTIAENLEARHVLPGLAWLTRHLSQRVVVDRTLQNAIVSQALELAKSAPTVRRRLATFVVQAAISHLHIWHSTAFDEVPAGKQLLRTDAELRGAVLESLLHTLSAAANKSAFPNNATDIAFWPPASAAFHELGLEIDAPEIAILVKCITKSRKTETLSRIALCILRANVVWENADHLSLLWPYRADSRFLNLFVGFPVEEPTVLQAIRVSREQREEARRAHEIEWSARRRMPEHAASWDGPQSVARSRVSHTKNAAELEAIVMGAAEGSESTAVLISLLQRSGSFAALRSGVIEELRSLSAKAKQSVSNRARTFLESRPRIALSRHGAGSLPTLGECGCFALLCLAALASDQLQQLSASATVHWMPVWIRAFAHDDEVERYFDAGLGHLATKYADDLGSTLQALLVAESCHLDEPGAPVGPTSIGPHPVELTKLVTRGGMSTLITERLMAVLGGSDVLQARAMRIACEFVIGPRVIDVLVESWRRLNIVSAAVSILRAVPPQQSRDVRWNSVAAIVCAAALRFDDSAVREEALAHLSASQYSVRDTLWWLVNGPHQTQGLKLESWDEAQVDALIRLVLEAFPPERRDDENRRSGSDELFSALARSYTSRGTREAVQGWRKLVEDMPNRRWLARYRTDAEIAYAERITKSVSLTDLSDLRRAQNRRLARTDAELLQLVCASVRDFEEELHGSLGAISTLWDEQRLLPRGVAAKAGPRWLPKRESELSNALARWLQRGLKELSPMIAREGVLSVELLDATAGQRTDLDIQVVPKEGGAPVLRVIVEVKGAWNRSVETAMETQLVRRYLLKNRISTGLYLVGYFGTADERRFEIHSLRDTLHRQAVRLSNENVLVSALVLDCRLDRPVA